MRVLRPFRWVRLSSGDDTNNVLFFKVAVIDDQNVHLNTHTEEDKALLQFRMFWIGNYPGKVVKECRLCFVEGNAVFGLVRRANCNVLHGPFQRMLEADLSNDAFFRGGEGGYQIGYQNLQISKPIRLGPQQNYGNIKFRQMLLDGQISVDSNEYVEFCCGQAQQPAVRYSYPPLIRDRANLNSTEAGYQPGINAFVEKDSQAASVTVSVVARSRKSTTCDRDTEGKPARKSSMESPASRYSSSV
jgi:hypothetical protein